MAISGAPPGDGASKRDHLRLGTGLLIVLVLLAIIVAIGLAIWLLPGVLVDESAYTSQDGQPDHAAAQDAYNAVRVPVGVTAAALLAAIAAGAGVWMNSRTVAVARDSLAQARANDDERRREWREEQLSSRFQDASKQLGDESAAVRLAGVYSMARLADDWEEQRGACVDVLCAYARLPLDEADMAERQVRRTILAEVFRRLHVEAQPSWSDCSVDLSGAFIEGLRHPGPLRISNLNLEKVTINDFTFLDQVQLESHISLDGATLRGSVRLLAVIDHAAAVSLRGVEVLPECTLHVGLFQSDTSRRVMPGYVRVSLTGLTINDTHATISLRGFWGERAVYGHNVCVSGGVLAVVMADGEAEPGTVQLVGSQLTNAATIRIGRSLTECASIEGAYDVIEDDEDLLDPDPREPLFIRRAGGNA